MIIERIASGIFGSNCYMAADKGECAIIDAGVEAEKIVSYAEKRGFKIKCLILTHAHIDHVFYAASLKQQTGADVMIHDADAHELLNPTLEFYGLPTGIGELKTVDRKLKDGDAVKIGDRELIIIHTPGHTPGCICIKAGGAVFTGDTLFRKTIGRTDLHGGNHQEIITSIKEQLFMLDDATVVYPGHSESTTIGFERENNPYVK